jgi:hypothetical protein
MPSKSSMMDDSATSWDEFRLASSSFGSGEDRRRNRTSLPGSTSSNSLRAASRVGTMKRSTSNSINEKLVNALWCNSTNNGKSRRNNDQAQFCWSPTAYSAKVRQRMQNPGVVQFLRENREGARMGRITSNGQFVPAIIVL